VQDGDTLESVHTDADGAYRFDDLTAGDYGISVFAEDCETAAALLILVDEQVLRHDVDLDPAGLPDDVVTSPF